MKVLWLTLLLAACGGTQTTTQNPPPLDPEPHPVVKDTRTPLEKRRDAACEIVGKRSATCAVEDAKRDFAVGKVTKEQLAIDTKPEFVEKLAAKYTGECKAHPDYSSRQIRVLEKCPQYETECEPLMKCLENVQPQSK
jgi:hypothetical protein